MNNTDVEMWLPCGTGEGRNGFGGMTNSARSSKGWTKAGMVSVVQRFNNSSLNLGQMLKSNY